MPFKIKINLISYALKKETHTPKFLPVAWLAQKINFHFPTAASFQTARNFAHTHTLTLNEMNDPPESNRGIGFPFQNKVE